MRRVIETWDGKVHTVSHFVDWKDQATANPDQALTAIVRMDDESLWSAFIADITIHTVH